MTDAGLLEDVILVLTGSDSVIIREARTFLTGRRGRASQVDFHLYPLSFSEYLDVSGIAGHASEHPLSSESAVVLIDAFRGYLMHGQVTWNSLARDLSIADDGGRLFRGPFPDGRHRVRHRRRISARGGNVDRADSLGRPEASTEVPQQHHLLKDRDVRPHSRATERVAALTPAAPGPVAPLRDVVTDIQLNGAREGRYPPWWPGCC